MTSKSSYTGPLWLDKHVTAVSAKCFPATAASSSSSLARLAYASVGTLVQAFVTSQVDYSNCLLAGATKASLNKLQRVLNMAARVVSDTSSDKHSS